MRCCLKERRARVVERCMDEFAVDEVECREGTVQRRARVDPMRFSSCFEVRKGTKKENRGSSSSMVGRKRGEESGVGSN